MLAREDLLLSLVGRQLLESFLSVIHELIAQVEALEEV